MKDILDKESYFKEFSKWTDNSSSLKNFSDEKLCEIALATRNFEIELYWKRSTYYWAFCAATIAAFALVYTKANPTIGTYTILAMLALCGATFSLGWYLANRGSKYWQENWESHMGLLITEYYGPIFKILKYPDQKKYWGLGGYPVSVSKINQVTSGVMTFVWVLLFIYSLCKIGGCSLSCLVEHPRIIITTLVILLSVIVIALLYFAESGHYRAYKKEKKKETEKKRPLFYMYE